MTTNTSPPSASPNDPANDEMTIWEHVTDLRKRLLVSLVALVVTVSISFYFSDDLIHILARPIGGIEKLISIEVTENVGVFMKVSLLSGFILALPLIVYEILGFIFKGLYEKERRRLLMIIHSICHASLPGRSCLCFFHHAAECIAVSAGVYWG